MAAGIAATFGAPVGGVLFSIEVTSTYYVVNNLWKAFFCSVTCCAVFMMMKFNAIADLLTNTKFEYFEFDWEVCSYAVLGIICGVVGAVFVHMTHRLIFIRKHHQIDFMTHRFRYTLSVAFLCAICTYQAAFMRQQDKDILRYTFQDKAEEGYGKDVWEEPNTGFNLLIYTMYKLLFTAISYSTPVPCGIFIPTFTAGATFGRLFGYVVNSLWGTTHLGVYSVIGAAALTSSVTHTISVAVIVFELTGDMHYMLAMLIAVLLAFAVGNSLSASIYDYLFDMKKLPYLPTVKSSNIYSKKAKEILKPADTVPSLHKDSSLYQLSQVLEQDLSSLYKLPILDVEEQLVGDAGVRNLRKYLVSRYVRCSQLFPYSVKCRLDTYFERLYASEPDTLQPSAGSLLQDCGDSSGGSEVTAFWNSPIDWTSHLLEFDEAPVCVLEETPLAKVHFMFMMLGLTQLYVVRRGGLVGYITRDGFSKHGV